MLLNSCQQYKTMVVEGMEQKQRDPVLGREALLALRRALIMLLDAVEDALGYPHSVVKTKKRLSR